MDSLESNRLFLKEIVCLSEVITIVIIQLQNKSEEQDMTAVLKLRKIGNSLGVILPKETTDRFHISAGDELAMIQTDRGIELSPFDQDFDVKLKAFERSRRKYRNALRGF